MLNHRNLISKHTSWSSFFRRWLLSIAYIIVRESENAYGEPVAIVEFISISDSRFRRQLADQKNDRLLGWWEWASPAVAYNYFANRSRLAKTWEIPVQWVNREGKQVKYTHYGKAD